MGFFYGLTGVSLIYVHKALDGDVADLRQIVVLLSFFYGGWIPAAVSCGVLFVFRFILFGQSSILLFLLSLLCTFGISHIVIKLPIPKPRRWYLLTAAAMLEIYLFLYIHGDYSRFLDYNLLHFAFAFILGSIFSYHFTESLRHSYQVTEELRRSQESLQRSEANYRLIAEYSSDLIAVVDVTGTAIYLSPSHVPMLGLIPEELIGKKMTLGIHPDDYPRVRDHWAEAVKQKKADRTEYRYRHAEGHWVWIESHYMPVLPTEGVIDKLVVISRDVTVRRQTEELIRDTEKLSVVGELAAGIAHEIRNPLTTLKGFVQMMKKDTFQRFYLDVMYDELDRIESITNELLYLAKPQVQEQKETDIREMLEQMTRLLYPQAVLHNILLTARYEDNLPLITCVENRLKQVFLNLLKNAIEAMPEGGEICLEASREEEGFLLITIKDEGIGISEERLEKLGQPFYSLKEKGTGLGLTVCKKIIQEHSGSLTFRSNVGVGTLVEVRLPIATRKFR